jgi:hypothetical protein
MGDSSFGDRDIAAFALDAEEAGALQHDRCASASTACEWVEDDRPTCPSLSAAGWGK